MYIGVHIRPLFMSTGLQQGHARRLGFCAIQQVQRRKLESARLQRIDEQTSQQTVGLRDQFVRIVALRPANEPHWVIIKQASFHAHAST